MSEYDDSPARVRAVSASNIPWLVLNAIEFVAAIFVLGFVGANYAVTTGDHSAAIYSIIISLATLLTAPLLAYLVIRPPLSKLWVLVVLGWQWILVILWVAAAGVLGSQSSGQGSHGLRVALGFALVEMIAFLVAGVWGAIGLCCGERKLIRKNIIV